MTNMQGTLICKKGKKSVLQSKESQRKDSEISVRLGRPIRNFEEDELRRVCHLQNSKTQNKSCACK